MNTIKSIQKGKVCPASFIIIGAGNKNENPSSCQTSNGMAIELETRLMVIILGQNQTDFLYYAHQLKSFSTYVDFARLSKLKIFPYLKVPFARAHGLKIFLCEEFGEYSEDVSAGRSYNKVNRQQVQFF